MRARIPRRSLTPARIAGAFVCALATFFATLPAAPGATSGTVVGANVLAAISLDDSGCRSSAALDLGALAVNTWAIGAPCSINFGSSNETARLKVWQRDETAPALESTTTTWTPRLGATQWNAVAAGSSTNIGWSAGTGGPGEPTVRFEKSTDSGVSWSATGLTTCNGNTVLDLDAFNDTALWSASATRICHSTDGGQTWTIDYTVPAGSIAHMVMISPTLGYAVGNSNHVYRTVNGTAWTDLGAVTSANFNYFASIHADTAGNIVIGARTSTLPTSSYGVVWSTNGGSSWSEQVLATGTGVDSSGVYGALVINPTTLLVSGPVMKTYRGTFSAGTWTWTQVYTATLSHVPYVRSGDGAIFAVTSGDSFYRSTDNGATWTGLAMNTGTGPHQREIAGNVNQLWVIGYTDRRVASPDAGANWTAPVNKPVWYAALAWSASKLFVAGSNGNAMRSTDGGATRNTWALGTASTINHGVSWPGGEGVLIGTTSTILRTTDYGATWAPVTPPAGSESWNEITVDDQNMTWMVSSTGKVASSADHGATWTLQTTVPGAPSLQAASAWRGQLWVGGAGGGVWRSSTTLPLAWTSVPTPRTTMVTSLWAIDATTAVALTDYDATADSSHFSRTTNSGGTWTVTSTASATGTLRHTRDLSIDPGHRFGWLTGSTSYSRSEDRGLSWNTPETAGVSQYIQRIQPTNGGRLLAVGDGSMISTSAPTASIPDGLAGAAGFGACLETATGVAATDWPLAGPGNCTSALTGNWNPIAVDASGGTARIATTALSGSGTLVLRFGVHAGPATTAGSYAANVVVEAVAPAV
ncbi:MAG: BNR/Asp-box repeat-containing protein [Thermoleophilia bacterium]|nr:BNR/Asp-box repeat-containing protein [Thermoleophilia bacterium]